MYGSIAERLYLALSGLLQGCDGVVDLKTAEEEDAHYKSGKSMWSYALNHHSSACCRLHSPGVYRMTGSASLAGVSPGCFGLNVDLVWDVQ